DQIKLPGCAAQKRLLIMDVSDRGLNEPVPLAAGGSALSFADLHHQLADTSQVSAVILSASDGAHISWPTTYPLAKGESAFLKAVFDLLPQNDSSKLGEFFGKVQQRFEASS